MGPKINNSLNQYPIRIKMVQLKDTIVWTLIGIFGVSLIFDGETRNDFYESFSYLFNKSTQEHENLTEMIRLLSGLLMMTAFFNLFGGILYKCISMFGFIFYIIFSCSDLVVRRYLEQADFLQLVYHIVIFLLCLDSIVNEILKSENSLKTATRQKANQVKQQAKAQAEKATIKKQNIVAQSKEEPNHDSKNTGAKKSKKNKVL